MTEFKVNNCHECPFCNNDNEYGHDSCNHPFNFDNAVYEGHPYNKFGEMPKDKVHDKCPLKDNPLTVAL